MPKFLNSILEWVAKNFRKDASKMLIFTGVAGWSLSSLAPICGIFFNPEIPNEQQVYLIPQELSDAVVNIGSFFLGTQMAKKTVSKLFSTGKFAPQEVRKFLDKNKDLYGKKIGKLDFDLDEVLKKTPDFPKDSYYTCKNFGTTVATVGAGILSSNIITPILRNNMASSMQKKYIDEKKALEKQPVKKNNTFKANTYSSIYPTSGNLRI